MNKPAILGGDPVFRKQIPIFRPYLPAFDEIAGSLKSVYQTGQITNGNKVRTFEEKVAEYLGVDHCVAVSSCTAGMMLLTKALNLSGDIIMPSFTFSATGHAMLWNGLTPIFADCYEDTLNLDTDRVEEKISTRTSAVLVTHIFGNPADIESLSELTSKYQLRLVFDAAHAFGSHYGADSIGRFGDAEVFSLSPTKVLTAGEGGLVTTNNKDLAAAIRVGRNYGDQGDYNCRFAGINARMTEWNAILGINSFDLLEENIKRRNHIAKLYESGFAALPGITLQKIRTGNTSTWKDFSIIIDEDKFGLNRDVIAVALDKEGIEVRKYFYPPLHKMIAYRKYTIDDEPQLPVTDYISKNILSLPIYYHLVDKDVEKIVCAVSRINYYAERIKSGLKGNNGTNNQ